MQHPSRFFAAASVAAILSLSACGEPKTITADEVKDPQAEALAKAKPVELPPAIQSSRAYRCKDNSLVYIDFYTNNTAVVRKEKGGDAVTTLTAPAAGQAYAAEGYSLSGNGPQVTYSAPGKGSKSCRA
ncbi:MAG TPA: hypothetical protein VNT25_01060 [Allosphingosinicella sp.]|nr:hypothetical protein [Allosphingosinicella sp.]